jgi:hypothetical protein
MLGRIGIVVMSLALATSWADESGDREAVLEVLDFFFSAMTAKNAVAMQEVMTIDGVMYGYTDGENGPEIFSITHTDYLEGLSTHEGLPVERIWNPRVDLHDRIAIAWTPYDFHNDGVFSHCGMNTFSLLKREDGWRITGVVFSVQTEGCEESPTGTLKQ